MAAHWETLYQKALLEVQADDARDACALARRAINERLTGLTGRSVSIEKERELLRDALRQLVIHEESRRRLTETPDSPPFA
jgi:hypothetical protein